MLLKKSMAMSIAGLMAAAMLFTGYSSVTAETANATKSSSEDQNSAPSVTTKLAPSGFVNWLEPSLPTNPPQTEEQDAYGKHVGRALPSAEFLRPTIDPGLPNYQQRRDIKISGNYTARCSDVLPYLVKDWIKEFQEMYPDVKINLSEPYVGSAGTVELINGGVDFVFVSRELKPEDLTNFKQKFGYDVTSVPISGGTYRHFGFLDSVSFFVNKANPIEKISFSQLDSILSSTRVRGGQEITTWGQLGLTGEWKDKKINIVGVQPWNGFEEFVRQRVLSVGDKRGEWRSDINFQKKVFPIAKLVQDDPYAIAYSGTAYVDADVKMLPLSAEDNGPYYSPSYENVAKAVYPLSRVFYFNINKAPNKELDPAVKELLRFILSKQGQQVTLNQGYYIPFRASQADASRKALALPNDDIQVVIDGTKQIMEQHPVDFNGEIFFPLNAIAGKLEATVEKDDKEKKLIITSKNNIKTELRLGSGFVIVDDQEIELDTNTRNYDGTALVPASFVNAAFGAKTSYDAPTNTVTIITK